MGTWTVTPSVEVEELPNGQLKVHFPDNPTTEEITYTIKYTPEGEGAKPCVRTVKQKGKEDNPIIYRNPDPTPNPNDDETTDLTFDNGCKENYQWIKVKTINEMAITSFSIIPSGWGTIEAAPEGGYRTNHYYKMTFSSLLPGVSKELNISATVENGKNTSTIKFNTVCSTVCDCNSIQFTKGSNIVAAATSVVFGTYTMKDNCYADKVTVVRVSDEQDEVVRWDTTGRTQQGNIYSLTAQTNPHAGIAQDYEFSFKLKYDTTECDTIYTLKQTHDFDCECSCYAITKLSDPEHNRDAEDNVTFGYITFRNSTCEENCKDNITFSRWPEDGIGENVRLVSLGNRKYEVKADITRTDESRKLSIDIMLGNKKCGTLGVYQRCFRGTDNGVDRFIGLNSHGVATDMKEEHPILLCGAEYYSSSRGKYVMPGDVDTIVVRDVQIECVCRDKDGNVVGSCVKENHDGTREAISGWHTITEFNYDDDGPSLIFNDWLRVHWKDEGSYNSPYGSIVSDSMSNNLGDAERKVRFWLRSSYEGPDKLIIWTNPTPGGDQPSHCGQEACQRWEYPVFQAPRCYGWCKIGNNENRFSGIFDAGHSSCSATYHDKWEEAIINNEKHEEGYCHVQDTEGPNVERFRDCKE